MKICSENSVKWENTCAQNNKYTFIVILQKHSTHWKHLEEDIE